MDHFPTYKALFKMIEDDLYIIYGDVASFVTTG